ncbi:hypothetical protein MPSEU_000532000 [Mayamaea pseudoterrestris]|nr:hypothetical protein MPSEU_000532000 [Mayamaea pseudoterrestris]
MSGQRSSDAEGTAESVAAGCSLRETPKRQPRQLLHNSHDDTLLCFCWGRGEDGQLGLGDTADQGEPTYVDALRGVGIKQIACGSGHTVSLTTDGEILTWGRGDDGRLGHGDNGWKYVPRLCQSLTGQVVVQVTCGSYHTAAVTSDGALHTWGGGMYGKLGHGNESGSSVPKRVEGLGGHTVSQIACGSRHTVIVTSTGATYSWGDNENGVAGHGYTEGHQCIPKLVDHLAGKKIVRISACGFHSACLSDADELFTWGEGKFGRLGHGTESNCHGPRLVESLVGKKPRQIACGGFHSAVVTEDGQLFSFGGGEHGQLGHNDRMNKLRPTLVIALEGVFISQIACGWSHSVALTAKGRLYTFGNSDHGKLGLGSGRRVAVPQLVKILKDYRVVRIASYNEHTAALVEPLDHRVGAAGAMNAVAVTATYTNHMRGLVNDDEFADVAFLVEGEQVHAHRAILTQRCEHFAAMFRSGMRESSERTIALPNMSKRIFLLLMEYIYTDTVKIQLDNAIDLYIMSDLYRLDRLRDMCGTFVRRNLNADNAGFLLQTASDAHCHVLREVCMQYMVANFDIVSKRDGIKQITLEIMLEILAQR